MRYWGVALGVLPLLALYGAPTNSSRQPNLPVLPISQTSPTVTLPAAVPDPTASLRPAVGEVHFLDPAFGWAPVSQPCGEWICISVYESHDSGANWTPRTGTPLIVKYGDRPWIRPSPMVRLATQQIGWLVDEQGTLYSTVDGAKTWREEPSDGVVVELQANGNSVWRLEKACVPSDRPCHYTLMMSDDYGRDWRQAQPSPPIGPRGAWFIRPSAETAYILSQRGETTLETRKPDPMLARTADGGRSWTTLTPPCSGYDNGSTYESPGSSGWDLAASSPRDLWLVCQGIAASGAQQPKHLFRSTDGGDTWSKDLGSPNPGAGGYTVAASPSRACRGGSRTSITCTRDGGQTWFVPIPDGADNPYDGGVTVYQFSDQRHAWAIAQDKDSGDYTVLWRTVDGGESWSPTRVGAAR